MSSGEAEPTGRNRHELLVAELQTLADGVVRESGLELVELELHGPSTNRKLRIFIDRPGSAGVTHDDCRRISERIGDELEQSDAVGRYVLEVSSPGIDRPIRSADDIRRNRGRRIAVATREPLDGRSEFHGRLLGEENGALTLLDDDKEIRIPIATIENAHQEVEI